MMSLRQFYLTKLAEECQEVAQRCMKSIQFGPTEVQKDQEKTNAQRLTDELIDLLAVRMLVERRTEDLALIPAAEFNERCREKERKIQKYLEYSQSLGMVGHE